MTSMTEKFISYLKDKLGDIYVWGAQGETYITEEWIRRRETSDANAERAIALWEKRKAEGRDPIAAFDCSGLIVKFLQDEGLVDYDISSRGLYSMSEKLSSRDELEPGDLVFRYNGEKIYHVGVYIGGGRVIEAKGRDDGVVERDIDASGSGYWNRYGRLELISGDIPPDENRFPAMYKYSGATYVNLRTLPSVQGEVIGRVNRDEEALVLEMLEDWAEVIVKKGSIYLRGYCASPRLVKIR